MATDAPDPKAYRCARCGIAEGTRGVRLSWSKRINGRKTCESKSACARRRNKRKAKLLAEAQAELTTGQVTP